MSESKHIPGPWRMNGTAIEAPCTGGVTASRYHYHIASVTDGLEEIDWRANARLISAAPDLLEACKSALAEVEADSNCQSEKEWAGSSKAKLWDTLRAAITKAEGK